MVTIKRIDIGSAFRIGALVTALISLIGFILFGLFQTLILTAMSSSLSGSARDSFGEGAVLLGGGIIGTLIFSVCGVVLYAVLGGIFTALYAWFYNIVAKQFGGLQVELSGMSTDDGSMSVAKGKRGFYDPDFEAEDKRAAT
jgi:Transmembrane domain of unknown function (DUF3566)